MAAKEIINNAEKQEKKQDVLNLDDIISSLMNSNDKVVTKKTSSLIRRHTITTNLTINNVNENLVDCNTGKFCKCSALTHTKKTNKTDSRAYVGSFTKSVNQPDGNFTSFIIEITFHFQIKVYL